MSERYSKVTVIVENGDTKETLEIFKADLITFEESAVPNRSFSDGTNSSLFFTGMLDMQLSLTGIYDDKEDSIYRTTRTTTAKEVVE
jgi:hypothetical protein